VKTKADAKAAYKAAARKAHPDTGGDAEKMKDINSSWDDFKQSPLYEKLAMAYWSNMASALLR
jgi:curved DNA-binding protein CbpA